MRQLWIGALAGVLSVVVAQQAIAVDKVDRAAPVAASSASRSEAHDFAARAARDGRAEIALGKLAEDKAKSSKVKDFARMMVKDHRKANDQLKEIAKRENIRLPDGMGPDNERLKERLAGKDGAGFDRAYIDAMVEDHEKAVRLFTDYQNGGADPALVAFARETLPVLRHHLDQAKALQQSLATQ